MAFTYAAGYTQAEHTHTHIQLFKIHYTAERVTGHSQVITLQEFMQIICCTKMKYTCFHCVECHVHIDGMIEHIQSNLQSVA